MLWRDGRRAGTQPRLGPICLLVPLASPGPGLLTLGITGHLATSLASPREMLVVTALPSPQLRRPSATPDSAEDPRSPPPGSADDPALLLQALRTSALLQTLPTTPLSSNTFLLFVSSRCLRSQPLSVWAPTSRLQHTRNFWFFQEGKRRSFQRHIFSFLLREKKGVENSNPQNYLGSMEHLA